jgi:hypothetical protein
MAKMEMEILVDCKRLVEELLRQDYKKMDYYSNRNMAIPDWLIYEYKKKEYALGLIDEIPKWERK